MLCAITFTPIFLLKTVVIENKKKNQNRVRMHLLHSRFFEPYLAVVDIFAPRDLRLNPSLFIVMNPRLFHFQAPQTPSIEAL